MSLGLFHGLWDSSAQEKPGPDLVLHPPHPHCALQLRILHAATLKGRTRAEFQQLLSRLVRHSVPQLPACPQPLICVQLVYGQLRWLCTNNKTGVCPQDQPQRVLRQGLRDDGTVVGDGE